MKKIAKSQKRAPAGLQGKSSPQKALGRPWQLGQSGNPAGKRKGRVSLKAAGPVLSRRDAEKIARALVGKAQRGSVQAVKLLAELAGDLRANANLAAIAIAGGGTAAAAPFESGLTEGKLREIIAALEQGDTVKKESYGLEVMPAKPLIHFAKLAQELHGAFAVPQEPASPAPQPDQ